MEFNFNLTNIVIAFCFTRTESYILRYKSILGGKWKRILVIFFPHRKIKLCKQLAVNAKLYLF